MSHGAQCMLCKTARWQGGRVVGCRYLEEDRQASSRVTIAVQSLLYRMASTGPCAARERLYVGPDAYLAQDRCDPDETGVRVPPRGKKISE